MMLVAPDAMLNVFCLSASLSLRLSVCDLQTLVWVFNLLPSVTCLPHPSHSLTAPHTPVCPWPLPLWVTSFFFTVSLYQLSLLLLPTFFLTAAPFISHLSRFPLCFFPALNPSLLSLSSTCPKRNTISKPSFSLFPWTPPQSFLDENAGHVHGTQARGDRDWPSGGMRWRLTAMFNIYTPQLYLYINAFICDIFLELYESSWPQHLKTHTHTHTKLPLCFVLITSGETKPPCTCNQSRCQLSRLMAPSSL